MIVAASEWPDTALAIAGIALIGSVVIVTLWQALATWRARMAGSREKEFRALAEQAVEANAQMLKRLDQTLTELRLLREELADVVQENATKKLADERGS